MIEKYLQDLERRIDPEVEEGLFGQWRTFADGQFTEEIFSPKRPKPALPSVEWPHVLVNDALEDCEAMALQQLELCSKALAEGSGALLAVRCNYGTAILPSLFGGGGTEGVRYFFRGVRYFSGAKKPRVISDT